MGNPWDFLACRPIDFISISSTIDFSVCVTVSRCPLLTMKVVTELVLSCILTYVPSMKTISKYGLVHRHQGLEFKHLFLGAQFNPWHLSY